MTIAILGAGAFGTALAVALAGNEPIRLWARDAKKAELIQKTRQNAARLPGIDLPSAITVSAMLDQTAQTVLLAMPMQQLAGFLAQYGSALDGKTLVACAKGIDLTSMNGPSALIQAACPRAQIAFLTGPSFAADIARGLPTALTLACTDDRIGADLQNQLSTPSLRLYRTDDIIGAELGGALKNVIAIAAGVVMGAGLGDSARAALMTRGFAEISRLALALGARSETLSGLSGFGDLVLTCTSPQSRNFRFGHALGAGEDFNKTTTVEGAATATAAANLARKYQIDMPVTNMVAALVDQRVTVREAADALLSRPLKKE